MSTNGDAQDAAAQRTLQLAGGRSLIVDRTNLVVHDPNPADKKSKKDGYQQRTIPLYNLLWAEVAGSSLTVEYVLLSGKKVFHVEKLSLPIDPPAAADAADADAEAPQPAQAFATELLTRAYGDAQQRRRAYVLVNPHAGPGNGVKRWEKEVRPIFDAARMAIDVVFLKKGGEATELVRTMDIDNYDVVIPCSGDGTAHEVFNGLAKRPDARVALGQVAVGHIPCGSGNAMSCNLYGSHKPSFAALALVKGVVTPLDLVSITQGDTRYVSFLSQSLGIVAESDLGTEHLRWMGSARFDFGVISRLFLRKVYPCDIAVQVEVEKPEVKEHYRRHASVTGLPTAAEQEANGENAVDGAANGESSAAGDAAGEDVGLPRLRFGTINDDLPEGWQLVPYDKIGTFYCGNMAYMAPDVNFFSAAIAADGCMDLITMNSDMSTPTALKTFMSVDSNKFFDSPHVHYKKVSAYRIIPRNQRDGYISIDGEKVPFAPFQAEVHRGLARVISKRGVFEAEGPADWDQVTVSERLHA